MTYNILTSVIYCFSGENFAVFRTADGKARITRAYCPHLGANLAVGGAVKGDCIECPFHKWRFDGATGKCVSIPNVETGQLRSILDFSNSVRS